MSPDSEPPDSEPDRDAALRLMRDAVDALGRGARDAVRRWVVDSVERIIRAYGRLDADTAEQARLRARERGEAAACDAMERLSSLRDADMTAPGAKGPLELLDGLSRYPTEVLEEAGVPAVERDGFDSQRFPDDVYDLQLKSFRDLPGGDELAAVHMAWGIAKVALLRADRGSLFE